MEHSHGEVTHSHGENPGRHFHPDPEGLDVVRWELPPHMTEDQAPEMEAAIRASVARRRAGRSA